MTTVRDILVTARSVITEVATSRSSSETFLEHVTAQPFEKSPTSKRDGFECVAENIELTHGFGETGQKEGQFTMVVKLGHAPFGTDDERENYRTQDATRLADILEAYAWPVGVMGVWFQREEVDKNVANWWISRLHFKVVYTGDIES